MRRSIKKPNDFPFEFKSYIEKVLPDGGTLEIDWFTGILVLPHGDLVNYVHVGYASTYTNYVLLEIDHGKLTGKRSYRDKQYEAFKERQFQVYRKTDEYIKQVEKMKKENHSQEYIDSYLRRHILNYTSKFLDIDNF